MARILRGEIYWAELDPTVGHEQSGLRLKNKLGEVSPEDLNTIIEGLNEIIST